MTFQTLYMSFYFYMICLSMRMICQPTPVISYLHVYAFDSSFTFNKVQSKADSLWRYNYYAVVYEHFDRPRFPILEALIRLMVNCVRNCIGDNYSEFSMYYVVATLYFSGYIFPNNQRSGWKHGIVDLSLGRYQLKIPYEAHYKAERCRPFSNIIFE